MLKRFVGLLAIVFLALAPVSAQTIVSRDDAPGVPAVFPYTTPDGKLVMVPGYVPFNPATGQVITGGGGGAYNGPLASQLPATLGAKTGATSLSVVPDTDTSFPITATVLPLPTGAATAAKQPTLDGNSDLRVPTVTVTAFYVNLAASTSTEILAASSTRIGYDIQCTGTAAIGISRTHATLTSATPSSGGADLVIPASSFPYFQPAYVSGAGVTAYTATAQACWGNSYVRQ